MYKEIDEYEDIRNKIHEIVNQLPDIALNEMLEDAQGNLKFYDAEYVEHQKKKDLGTTNAK